MMEITIDLNAKYLPQATVVTNGVITDDEETQRLLRASKHIVICDGALAKYLKLTRRVPDVVIGDGDSVNHEDLMTLGLDLTQVDDQETNDLTKAVHFAHRQGWNDLAVIGATGLREDHTIGNIFLLPEYFKMGVTSRIYSPYGWLMVFQGHLQLMADMGQEISLFATENKPISASGVAYPFELRTFSSLWQATLNVITEPIVKLYSEGIAIVYVSHERRQ